METLNENEKQVAAEIGYYLKKAHTGANNAVCARKIAAGMFERAKSFGVRMNEKRVREMVNWLRTSNTTERICSTTTGGYFVAETIEEFEKCCTALRERMATQYKTEKALRAQLIRWKNENQTTLNL